ncbi:MAG: histidine--tRNA ligase [Pyrinomonadaceae bacterium]|nr:histidine--tRNA ligase [Pyrinomonadaceae bacterium]MBA3568632.1 histidine--tRNA ligase [Pyrinomonadaceae bacterium]
MGSSTLPARGMRDFLPADVRRREYVIGVIKEVYERYGFEPLETPAVENIETLMGKYGEEGNQLIYKILKRGVHESTGEADLALRYDLTVPLARVVAEYRDKLPKFFKRYQIQPVWRADRPARGRFREFYQCDVDVIGSCSMVVETELIAAASEALEKLGFKEFVVSLNHREALTGLLACSGVPLEHHEATLVALDKLAKVGRERVARELTERGITEGAGKRLLDFFSELDSLEHAADIAVGDDLVAKRQGLNSAILGRLVEFVGTNEKGAKGVDELRSILEYAGASGVAARIKIDPSLARGLSYYTGAILEINVKDLAGSLGGGGRYDNLVGMFLGQDVPACGFSLGLERIIVVMTEREMFPTALARESSDVMMAALGEQYVDDALTVARELRAAGMRVLLYPQPTDKLQKQLAYASAQNIALVALSGEHEHNSGTVLIKDMHGRSQEWVTREVAVDVIRNMLSVAKGTIEIERKREDYDRSEKH